MSDKPALPEPVAEVMSGWVIAWIGAEPIAHLLARHPEVRIGTKLYSGAALATQAEAHAAELASVRVSREHIMAGLLATEEELLNTRDSLAEAREQLSAHDAIRAQLEAERDALRADARLLDWIECCAMNGQIQIARSTLRTGYEIAVLDRVGPISVTVEKGTLREALAARTGSKPE